MATNNKADYLTIKIPSSHLAFISDIHLGKYSSSEEWQNNIRDYFENWFYAYIKSKVEQYPDLVLMCLGDVYDNRTAIDIDVNNLAIDIFEELARILPVYILYGNHDLSKKTNNGNSSLRSLSNIKNVTIISEPTLIKFMNGRSVLKTAVAVPYMGDCAEENAQLLKFADKAEYAFMHTDISDMKFGNGMTIVGGIDSNKFSGKIYSGHIHKRQETKKVVYVGSPYHLTMADIGNSCGIYVLDLSTGKTEFTENTYSPTFKRIKAEKLLGMTESEQSRFLSNAYVEVIVEESDKEDRIKKADIHAIMSKFPIRRYETKTKITKLEGEVTDMSDYHELSLEELIAQNIDGLTDCDDERKARLKVLSDRYYKTAVEEIAKLSL